MTGAISGGNILTKQSLIFCTGKAWLLFVHFKSKVLFLRVAALSKERRLSEWAMPDPTYENYRKSMVRRKPFWNRFWDEPAVPLSIVADALGIGGVVTAALVTDASSRAFSAIVVLTVLAALALIASFGFHRRSLRNAGYPYAFVGMHSAIHVLRDELATTAEWNRNRLTEVMARVLTSFSSAFTTILGSPCRSCIKVIRIEPPQGRELKSLSHSECLEYSYARTLSRDQITAGQIGHQDRTATEAPIQGNTAFRFLFEDCRRRFFPGNNLPRMMKQGQYANTSVHKYCAQGDHDWSLPYRSTLVWPIRMKLAEAPGSGIAERQNLLGFLCVDAVVTDRFRPEIDFEIGALLADALYSFLVQFGELLEEPDSKPPVPQSEPKEG